MADRTLVAIDLGAESGRVLTGVFDGSRVGLQETRRFANRPVRVCGHIHWDVLHLFDEIQTGLATTGHEHGPVSSLGVDAWGVDFGLLDRFGTLIGNPYHYRDTRTDGIMERVFRVMTPAEVFARTGSQFLQINSLFQLYSMASSPALDCAATLLMMPNLFNYWLTGVKAVEFTVATTTQFFDPVDKSWAGDLLKALGIPSHILPEVMPPATVLGRLLPEIAALPGLGHSSVVAPACHDTASAVAAIPAVVGDYAYISSGTWSLMGFVSPGPFVTEAALAYNITNEGGVEGSIRVLKVLTGLWLVQECRRAWNRAGAALSYDDLTGLASQARPLAALVNPDDPSFLHPADMPSAIGEYCKTTRQRVPEGRGGLVRVALESLALKYRMTLEELELLRGRRLEVIHVVGGGSQNQLLCQFTADACNRPVYAGPVEATALGNILAQLIATGECRSWAEARELARASTVLREFAPHPDERWDEAYARFSRLVADPRPLAVGDM